ERPSAGGPAPGPVVRPRVRVLQPPTQSGEVAGVGARRVLAAVQAPGGRDLRGAGARGDQRPGVIPVAGRDRGRARAATVYSLTQRWVTILSVSSYSTYIVVIVAAGGGGRWRRQAAQRLKQSSTNSATRSNGSTKRTQRCASGCSC